VFQGRGTHITSDTCSWVGEHISLVICVALLGKQISLCVSQVGKHTSLVICISWVGGTHVTKDMSFPGRGTHITRDMLFLGGGTHITSDMCFPGRRTHINGDMSFSGRGTHITTDICFPVAITVQCFQTYLDGMFGITAGCDFP